LSPHARRERTRTPNALLERLEHPRAARLVAVLGVLLGLPTLAAGFFSDDWFMLAALRHRWPQAPPWWDLYDFVATTDDGVRADVAHGLLPWWTPSSLRLHLVRPLSSALLALDHRVFGDAPLGWHVHSLVWWALLLLVVAALLRRLLPGATGTLALLMFVVIPGHSQDYGWLSARHMLVGALPSLAGLLAHLRAREDGWRPGRWLGPLGLAVGLAGSEAALGAVAFWVAYEVLGPAALGDRRRRALGAAPAVLVTAAYLVAYRLAGGGVVSSDDYVTPLPDPVKFVAKLVARLPMLLGDALLGVPVELSFGESRLPFIAVGLAGAALCAWLAWTVRDLATTAERAALRWLVPGALLAVLGTCGGMPGARALMIANLGFVALLAVLVRRGLERGGATVRRRLASGLLAGMHLGLAPLVLLAGYVFAIGMARREEAIARALPAEVAPARRVFLLAASDPMTSIYVMATLLADGGAGLDCVARLTAARTDFRVTRLDGMTLAIEPVGTPLLRGLWETLYRARSMPVQAGDEVSVCGARIRVASVDGGSPTRLEVHFGVPLDHPDLATVAWDGSKLALVRLEPGETRLLPWRRGPLGNQ
jgi:hypothetical protein